MSNSWSRIRIMKMPLNRSEIVELLRQHGINLTHQRLEIAQFLYSRPGHWSAEQVLAHVNREHDEVSKATVYNTLNLFVENDMIREIIADPTRVFYDANMVPHHHFYDVDAGEISDIMSDEDIRIEGLPPLPEGMVAEGIDVIVLVRRARPELQPVA